MHPSPSFPHAPDAWQTDTDSLIETHEPEQQSPSEPQSSHSVRQPPAAAQRAVPSLVGRHWREQQSLLFPQASPTCAVQLMLSLVVQLGRGVQWPTAFASAVQVAEQQSAPLVQISPSTRHAWRSPQRGWPSLPFAQTLPQQSPFFAHDSPAGLHDALVATQWPAVQRWAQQSAALAHAPPANVQSGEAPHVRSVPAGTHASEQHAPAKAHERPFPRQPFVGRHVSFDVGSSAQSPEQHAVELVHGWPVAVRAHSPPSGALGAASPSGSRLLHLEGVVGRVLGLGRVNGTCLGHRCRRRGERFEHVHGGDLTRAGQCEDRTNRRT